MEIAIINKKTLKFTCLLSQFLFIQFVSNVIHAEKKEDWLNKGKQAITEGYYIKATEYFNKLLNSNPENAEIYYERGKAYAKSGLYNKSISDFTKAISLDSTNVEFYYSRGNVYADKKLDKEAIADFDMVINLEPKYKDAYYNRGMLYGQKGLFDNAIKDFTTYIDLSPKNPMGYNQRGLLYYKKGSYQDAIKDFSTAIKINPKLSLSYTHRSWVYEDIGKHEMSVKDSMEAHYREDDIVTSDKILVGHWVSSIPGKIEIHWFFGTKKTFLLGIPINKPNQKIVDEHYYKIKYIETGGGPKKYEHNTLNIELTGGALGEGILPYNLIFEEGNHREFTRVNLLNSTEKNDKFKYINNKQKP